MASYLSTSAHLLIIRTPVVAYHGQSDAPKLVYTSDFHVAVAISLSLDIRLAEKEILASRGNYVEACKHDCLPRNAGYEGSDWSG